MAKTKLTPDGANTHAPASAPRPRRDPSLTRRGVAGPKSLGAFPEVNRTRLAERLHVDVGYLTQILNGARRPGIKMAFRIASALSSANGRTVTVFDLTEALAALRHARERAQSQTRRQVRVNTLVKGSKGSKTK